MQDNKIAKALRELADRLEAGESATVSVQTFYEDVPNMHTPLIDQKYIGRSVVIHEGSANDQMLAVRILEESGTISYFFRPQALIQKSI